jgi:hypothetical protein
MAVRVAPGWLSRAPGPAAGMSRAASAAARAGTVRKIGSWCARSPVAPFTAWQDRRAWRCGVTAAPSRRKSSPAGVAGGSAAHGLARPNAAQNPSWPVPARPTRCAGRSGAPQAPPGRRTAPAAGSAQLRGTGYTGPPRNYNSACRARARAEGDLGVLITRTDVLSGAASEQVRNRAAGLAPAVAGLAVQLAADPALRVSVISYRDGSQALEVLRAGPPRHTGHTIDTAGSPAPACRLPGPCPSPTSPASPGPPAPPPAPSAPRPWWRPAEPAGPPRSATAACGSAAGRRQHAGCRRARPNR